MRTLLLVLGVGAVILLALGWAGKAWGQLSPTVVTNANANAGQGPILILPPGADPELVLRAVAALRGTPAILPDSAIIPGTPLQVTPSPTGGAIDVPVVAAPVPAPVPAPTPPPRVLRDPPMANPGPNPKTISLF